jgi:hypothetical protein
MSTRITEGSLRDSVNQEGHTTSTTSIYDASMSPHIDLLFLMINKQYHSQLCLIMISSSCNGFKYSHESVPVLNILEKNFITNCGPIRLEKSVYTVMYREYTIHTFF